MQLQLILLDKYLAVKTKTNSLQCKYKNVKLNHLNDQDQTIVNLKLIHPIGTTLNKVSFSAKFSNLGSTNEFVNLFNFNRDYSENDDISKIRFQKKVNYSFNFEDQNNDFKVRFLDQDRKFKNNGFIRFDFNRNQIIILILPKFTQILNHKNILNSYIIRHPSNDRLLRLNSQKFDEFIFLTSSKKRTAQLKEKMRLMKRQLQSGLNTNKRRRHLSGGGTNSGSGSGYDSDSDSDYGHDGKYDNNDGGGGGDEDNISSIIKKVNKNLKDSNFDQKKNSHKVNSKYDNDKGHYNDINSKYDDNNKTGNVNKSRNKNNKQEYNKDEKKRTLNKEKTASLIMKLKNRTKPIVYKIEFLNNKLINNSNGRLGIYYNKRRLLIYQNQKSKYSIYLKPNSNEIDIALSNSKWDVIKLTYQKEEKGSRKKINWRIKFESLQQKNNFIEIIKILTNYNKYKKIKNNTVRNNIKNHNHKHSQRRSLDSHNSDLHSKKQKRELKKTIKSENKDLDLFEENTVKEKIYEFILNDKGNFVEQGRIILKGKKGYIKFLGSNTIEKIDFNGIGLWRSNNQPKVVSLNMSNYRNFTFVLFSKEIALDLFQNLHSIKNKLNN